FILDEMTTFKVRDFEKLPSVLREYGAAFLLLTQSEGKLEKLYSKLDRSSIETNFGNIFLGRTLDVEALKYYPLFFGKYEKEKKS
ncbi:TraM recognition domain-containing protein, partial [Phocaeicola vulgatus]